MIDISRNKIITMNKGDYVCIPLILALKSKNMCGEIEYTLRDEDIVQFRIMNCNDTWDDAIIKKEYTKDNFCGNNRINIILDGEDTINMESGKYFYEIKFITYLEGEELVDTIISRREFILLD